MLGEPAYISIEPTNACNLACPECPTGNKSSKRIKSTMSVDSFKQIIDKIKKTCFYVNLFFQGEPYLNDSIFELISIAHKNNIFTSISTNGHYLTVENAEKTVDAKLDKLIISLDGIDYKTYKKYRINGNFDTVIDGIRNIVDARIKKGTSFPLIEIQCLLLSTTQHTLQDFKLFAHSLGADIITFKTAQFYNLDLGSDLMPDTSLSRYKKTEDGSYEIKKKLNPYCWRMWSNPVITSNGDFIPCCFDKNCTFVQGNLLDQSLQEIWNTKGYTQLRNTIIHNRKSIEICRNCTS